MATADPHDAAALAAQIARCAEAGADLVRLTVPDLAAARVLVESDLELDRGEGVLEEQGHRRAVFVVFAQRDQQVFLLADVGGDGVLELSVFDGRSGVRVVTGRIEGMLVRAAGPAQALVIRCYPVVSGFGEQEIVHPVVGSPLYTDHLEGTDGGNLRATRPFIVVDDMDDKRPPGVRSGG